jgi:hypothetical protein
MSGQISALGQGAVAPADEAVTVVVVGAFALSVFAHLNLLMIVPTENIKRISLTRRALRGEFRNPVGKVV